MSNGIIEIGNLNFTYNGSATPAIKNLSLTVQKGEILAVIGHNGSGKSTLARLINGLLTPDSGTISVLGLNMGENGNEFEIRKHVGVVFQNPDNQMVASIVEDDIAFGPENIGIECGEIGRRIDWALKAVGMEKYRESTPTRLSGGQKQRIAIAGVLAIKPEIIILDESTAMLDPRGRREVMDVVTRLNREEGMTVIVITHFLEEALAADRTVVLNRGEIALSGTPEEIFRQGEMLETFGISLPKICSIGEKLKAGGMVIDSVLRPAEMVGEIYKNFVSRGICAGQSSPQATKTDEITLDTDGENWDINVKNLTFTYSKKSPFATKALNGLNLTIRDGEFFGIIGHTGSGKSTLVQHLNALITLPQVSKKYRPPKVKKGAQPPALPEITVGKFNLADKKCDFRALRANVGMVFQYPEYQLFAETVFKDVAFGLQNFNKNISPEELEAAVRSSIEIVGLNYDEIKEKSPFDLSGGQKRRVAIAGVIVTKPRILILDEPAAGLDPKGKKEIMELLHTLHRNWCRTVVIVSHDMDEIAENCTRCAVVSEGQVVDCDYPANVFSRAERLYSLGLDIPLTAKLQEGLKERGIVICSDCTEDGFVQKTLEVYREGENA